MALRQPLPLTAVQLLYVNLATDGLPALALAVDPAERGLMRRAPRDPHAGVFTPRVVALLAVAGAWAALSGVAACGYEIHHGQTAQHPAMAAKGDVAREVMPGIAWQNPAGNVLGVYLHGLFEDTAVLHALFGAQAPTLDAVFDGLADGVARHFEPGVLDALILERSPP